MREFRIVPHHGVGPVVMQALSALLIVMMVGICLGAEQEKQRDIEPLYHGKTLSEWSNFAEDKDPAIRIRAAKALGITGPDSKTAVPVLIKLLKDKNEDVRRAATKSLGLIGPEAKTAIPALIELLKEHREPPTCLVIDDGESLALGRIGSRSHSSLDETVHRQ